MKNVNYLYTVILICIFPLFCFSQIDNSDCSANDDIIKQYRSDADLLALRKILRTNSIYSDSIIIPKQLSDSILKALIAVYNATSIPERDTVVKVYDIHTFPDISMSFLTIIADSNLPWVQKLKSHNLNTGQPALDSILHLYNFTIKNSYAYSGSRHVVVLQTDSNLNLKAITKPISKIKGVEMVEPEGMVGGGTDIRDSIYNDHIELTYSAGWGDCPSGCTFRRYWKFNVYFDCTVEFVESYGDATYRTKFEDINNQSITIFPNPIVDYLEIKENLNNCKLLIYNALGEPVFKSNFPVKGNFNLTSLTSGIYLLHIKNGKHVTSKKFVKQ